MRIFRNSRRDFGCFVELFVLLTTAIIVAVVFTVAAAICSAAIDDALAATCRIKATDGGVGTGTCYRIDGGRVLVLTCAHVATSQQLACEFWSNGHQSAPLSATLVLRDQAADTAVLVIDAAAFGGRLPRAIPLADRGTILSPGLTLASAGCANGAWSTAWQGHFLRYPNGSCFEFTPPPSNGRSGSAILNADGTRIVGLLNSRATDNSAGLAVSLESIYRALEQRTASMPIAKKASSAPLVPVVYKPAILAPMVQVQCPGGQCGPGGCKGGGQQSRGGSVLPWRNKVEIDIQGGRGGSGNPYPTLPAPQFEPMPQPIIHQAPPDLSPVTAALNRIADRMEAAQQQQPVPSPVASTPVSAPPDPAFVKQVNDGFAKLGEATDAADKKATEAANLAKSATETATAAVAKAAAVEADHAKLEQVIQDHGTLKERFAMNRDEAREKLGENASRIKVDLEAAKETIHEKIASLKESHGDTRLIILIVAAGVAVIFVCLVVKDIKNKKATGDPLEIEKLAAKLTAAATGHPGIVPLANLASRGATDIAGLIDQLTGHVAQAKAAAETAKAAAISAITPK